MKELENARRGVNVDSSIMAIQMEAELLGTGIKYSCSSSSSMLLCTGSNEINTYTI